MTEERGKVYQMWPTRQVKPHQFDLRRGPRHDIPSFADKSSTRLRLASSPGKLGLFTDRLASACWSIAAGVVGAWLIGSGIIWSLDPSDWGAEVRTVVVLFLAPSIGGLTWLAREMLR